MTDQATGTQEAEPADDLRSMLSQAMDVAEAPEPIVTKAPEPKAGVEPATIPDSRERNPDGTFKAKAGDAEPALEALAEPAGEPVIDPAAVVPEPAQTTTAQAPTNWAQADKDTFAKLPPEAQTILLDRHRAMEGDYTRKTQEIAHLKREFEPVAQLLAPHMDAIRAQGQTVPGIIQGWMNVERNLQTPATNARTLIEIAQRFGVNWQQVSDLLQAQPAQTAQPAVDPAQQAALQPLMTKMGQMEAYIAQQQQERLRQEQATLAQQITSFAGAKDATGQPLHPHFDEIRQDMGALMDAARIRGQTLDLDQAYDQAVFANPSTRAKVLAAQSAAQQAKAQAEARAKAVAAQKAGSSVTGGPSAGQTAKVVPVSRSLREDLEAAAAEAAA